MGMPISLALRGRHATGEHADAAWAAVMASLRDADAVFSTYREDSVISRLGRGELDASTCPDEVIEVLALGERARVESAGAFDVRRGDREGNVVLDPSGVVKGWAVQRASRALDGLDDTDYCLSAGGDMVVRTIRRTSPAWRIGIEDPFDPTRVIATVAVRNGAVATSGLARRGAHIVDPRTRETPMALASVTVVAPELTWADIDATAAFVLGRGAVEWLERRPGRRGVVVAADGTTAVFDASRSRPGPPPSQFHTRPSRSDPGTWREHTGRTGSTQTRDRDSETETYE
jgi:thiamine biosynthesis lipoprotein